MIEIDYLSRLTKSDEFDWVGALDRAREWIPSLPSLDVLDGVDGGRLRSWLVGKTTGELGVDDGDVCCGDRERRGLDGGRRTGEYIAIAGQHRERLIERVDATETRTDARKLPRPRSRFCRALHRRAHGCQSRSLITLGRCRYGGRRQTEPNEIWTGDVPGGAVDATGWW